MSTGIQVSGMNTTFSYLFYKYSWILNATYTHTRGYRLVPESVPNGVFTRGHMDNGYPLPSLLSTVIGGIELSFRTLFIK
jgi:hypothetical protein